MKLDCEGAEYSILFDTPQPVLEHIQRIVMEYHDNIVQYTHNDLIRFLNEQGISSRNVPKSSTFSILDICARSEKIKRGNMMQEPSVLDFVKAAHVIGCKNYSIPLQIVEAAIQVRSFGKKSRRILFIAQTYPSRTVSEAVLRFPWPVLLVLSLGLWAQLSLEPHQKVRAHLAAWIRFLCFGGLDSDTA